MTSPDGTWLPSRPRSSLEMREPAVQKAAPGAWHPRSPLRPSPCSTCQLPIAERASDLARQGQAHLSSDLVRVIDDQMNDIPQDRQTMGEVVMRGNIVMSAYLDDPAATSKAFHGGWFHSGDLLDAACTLRPRTIRFELSRRKRHRAVIRANRRWS